MIERAPIPDETLLGKLDACKELTESERRAVIAGMEKFVARGNLTKLTRDHLMAIARARKLFTSTEAKPSKAPRSLAPENPGDIFSTRPGPVDPRCLVLPKRPPGRRCA